MLTSESATYEASKLSVERGALDEYESQPGRWENGADSARNRRVGDESMV